MAWNQDNAEMFVELRSVDETGPAATWEHSGAASGIGVLLANMQVHGRASNRSGEDDEVQSRGASRPAQQVPRACAEAKRIQMPFLRAINRA
jgi:hypothetical protein